MSVPTLSPRPGGYTLKWESELIKAEVERIHVGSEHTTAEVTLLTSLPGVPSHLHQERLSLTSGVAKGRLARQLAKRYEAIPVDWDVMVEQLCVLVLRAVRVGEDVVDLSTIDPPERVGYRLEPLLLEKQANLIMGMGGLGKSLFAAFCAVLVAVPWREAGLVGEPGGVLVLDYESSEDDWYWRLDALAKGMGIETPHGVLYRRCTQALADEADRIQRIITDRGIDLLIVDSVGLASGGEDIERANTALRYFGALRTLNCTTLSIHHVAKNSEQKTPFGSAYFWNVPRCVWEIRKAQDAGSDQLAVGLFQRKANMGRTAKPLGLTFDFATKGEIRVKGADVSDIPDLEANLPHWQRIQTVLKRGALTVADIAEETGLPEPAVRLVFARYPDRFTRLGDERRSAKWALLVHDTTEV